MNSSAISWISEQGMDYSMFIDQFDFMADPFDEDFAAMFGQDFPNYLSPESNSSSSSSAFRNTPNSNSINSLQTSPTMEQSEQQTLDSNSMFSVMNSPINPDQASVPPLAVNSINQNPWEQNLQEGSPRPRPEEVVVPEVVRASEEPKPKVKSTKKRSRARQPSQTYDHIVAERRRREQLSQLLVALSALVPGLKKMDKSSVLEDAIKYLKYLQERVKTLEEKAENQNTESLMFVRKSLIVLEDEGSSDEQSCTFDEQPLPEIEARTCDNHILLRVQCEKQKGVLAKLLRKIESLHMTVASTNSIPFGNVALDITVIAELEEEFNLTGHEVVTALRAVLQPAA